MAHYLSRPRIDLLSCSFSWQPLRFELDGNLLCTLHEAEQNNSNTHTFAKLPDSTSHRWSDLPRGNPTAQLRWERPLALFRANLLPDVDYPRILDTSDRPPVDFLQANKPNLRLKFQGIIKKEEAEALEPRPPYETS